MKNNKKAFTLIELLVVIAIIGILATVSVIALNNARAKSRDAKRAGDIKQIQTALELFYNDNNRYPTPTEWNTGKIYSTSTDSTSTYMQIIPNAPSPSDGSCTNNQNAINYGVAGDGSSYSISFCLGNNTGTLIPGPKCLTPAGIVNSDCSICSSETPAGSSCSYGGEIYPTIQIGTQVWMAKNLNVGNMLCADNPGGASCSDDPADNTTIEKYCYNNLATNCQSEGGLYQWDEAMQYSVVPGAKGICPSGWHIPTDAEQNILDQYLNDTTCDSGRVGVWDCANAGSKLKLGGSSSFSNLSSGYQYVDGSFVFQNTRSGIWSSSMDIDGINVFVRILFSDYVTVARSLHEHDRGFSVRCLKD